MNLKPWIGLIIIIVVVSGYFLANAIHYTDKPPTGYGGFEPNNLYSILQFFAQVLYLCLAGSIIAFVCAFTELKNFKLFWLIILGSFLLISITGVSGYGVHGRYVDPLVPLILIPAFAYKTNPNKKPLIFGFGIALMVSTSFSLFYRDTINCFTNIYVITPGIQYLYIFAVFVIFMFLMLSKNNKRILSIIFITLLICFTASNVLNFQFESEASENAFEYATIGKCIHENGLKGIVFDENDCRDWWATYCLTNFWNKDFIPVGNISGNYFISSKELPYDVLVTEDRFKEVEGDSTDILYLYKIGT